MPAPSTIEIHRLSPAIGAAITGIDLHAPLDDDTFAAVHDAFLANCVLVFPGQHLGPAEQQAFGERFGEPLVVPYLAPHALPGYPAILRVTNMGKAQTLTENWHYDSAYFDEPPPIAILAAQQLPDFGGDTMWANAYAAYEALSERMQDVLSGLRAAFTGYGRRRRRAAPRRRHVPPGRAHPPAHQTPERSASAGSNQYRTSKA